MVFIIVILSYIFIAIITFVMIVLSYLKWNFTYWKRLGVVYRKPTIPFGNFMETAKQRKTVGQIISEIYAEMKRKGAKHAGVYFFHEPIYLPLDLEIIKRVIQNDFEHFTDHGIYFNERDDPLSAHLFALEGTKWRNARMKLTSIFTSGKMRIMFPYMVKLFDEFKTVLDEGPPNEPVEMRDFLIRFIIDIVGSCAFGLNCNSLRDGDNDFQKYGRRLLDLNQKEVAVGFVGFVGRNLLRFFKAKPLPEVVTKFFMAVVKDATDFREKNGIKRDDMLQLLIQMKNDTADSKLSFEETAAHALVFFMASLENCPTIMSFFLFEVALNQDIQQKLRDEINDVLHKHKGELTYEAMMEMQYMDMTIKETMRKYPSVPVIRRKCTKDYKLPGTDIVLKKGVKLLISIDGIHHDPEYFENPEVFDPLRFTEENKRNRPPFAFLPFSEGPRICIGLRFGLIQVKVGLILLLKNYKFRLNSKTKLPVKLDHRNFMHTIRQDMWMNVEKISS